MSSSSFSLFAVWPVVTSRYFKDCTARLVSCLAVRGPTRGENQAETVWEKIYRVSLPSGWTLNYWVTLTASSAFCIWQDPGPDLRFTQIRLHFNGVTFCASFDIIIPRAPHFLAVTAPLKEKKKKLKRCDGGK